MSSTARSLDGYVDSSAFVALLDRSDSHHALFRRHFATPPRLVTTPLVVAESQAWFLRRYDAMRGLQFLAFLEELAPLEILPVDATDILGGTEMLRRFADQQLTLTDAVGLHVMKRLRIRSCWSTDRHLGLTGVRLLTQG